MDISGGVSFCCYNQLYKRGLEGARKAEDLGPKSLQPILTPEQSTIMENLLWSMIGFDVTRDHPITCQSLYQGELWMGADQVRTRLLGMSPRAGGSVVGLVTKGGKTAARSIRAMETTWFTLRLPSFLLAHSGICGPDCPHAV